VLTKRKLLCCIVSLFAISLTVIQVKEETIAGISVKVISEYRSTFEVQFISLVIAEESYSRKNLESIWRYYREKYNNKDRLDLRIYLNRTYEYNRQFDGWPVDMHKGEAIGPNGTRVRLRTFEAYFVRSYGEDNELMIYSPNIDEPEKKERVVLAGKDPF